MAQALLAKLDRSFRLTIPPSDAKTLDGSLYESMAGQE